MDKDKKQTKTLNVATISNDRVDWSSIYFCFQ